MSKFIDELNADIKTIQDDDNFSAIDKTDLSTRLLGIAKLAAADELGDVCDVVNKMICAVAVIPFECVWTKDDILAIYLLLLKLAESEG